MGASGDLKTLVIQSTISGGENTRLSIRTTLNSPSTEANYMDILSANNPFQGTWLVGKGFSTDRPEAFLRVRASNTLGNTASVLILPFERVSLLADQTLENLTFHTGSREALGELLGGTFQANGQNLTVTGKTTRNGDNRILAESGNQHLGILEVTGTSNYLSVSNPYTSSLILNENSTLSIGKGFFRLENSSISLADTAKILLGYNEDGTLSSQTTIFSLNVNTNRKATLPNAHLGNASIINGIGGSVELAGTLYVGSMGNLRAASNSEETQRILTISSDIASESDTAKGELYLISSNAEGSQARLTGNNENFAGNLYIGKSDFSGGAKTVAEIEGNFSLGKGNVSVLLGSSLVGIGNPEILSLILEENSELTILEGEWKVTDSFTFSELSKVTIQLSNDLSTSLILPEGELGGEIYLDSFEYLDVGQSYPFLQTSDSDFGRIFLSETLQNAGFRIFYSEDGFSVGTLSTVPEPTTWSVLLSGRIWLLFQVFYKRK